MIAIVARRFLEAIVTLLLLSTLVFAAARVLGDPVAGMLGPDATQAARSAMEHRLGLDRPLLAQYGIFLTSTLRGDLGQSIHTGVPVWESIKARSPASLLLALTSTLFALAVAIPLGVLSATHKNGAWDSIARTFALVGQGTPSFLLAILAVLLLAVKLPIFPAGGFNGPLDIVLPSVTLGWFISAGILRLLRSSLGEVLQSDYVLFARSFGMSNWRVIWTWALPNALLSVMTFVGYMFAVIIAGAIVVEAVFVWPGLGRLAYEAVLARDLPLIQGTVLVLAVFTIGSNLLVDVGYIVLDPRLRHRRQGA